MTLLEIATVAATKARRQNDTDSIAIAKTLIQSRYKTIYADGLWRDSLFSQTINFNISGTADPHNTTALNAAGVYIFSPLVERLIALRTSSSGMGVVSGEDLMISEPDVFTKTGNPIGYEILSPVVAAWTEPITLQVKAANAADSGLYSRLIGISSSGGRTSVLVPLSVTDQPAFDDIIELERWTKPTTTGNVTLTDLLSATIHGTMLPSEMSYQPKVRIRLVPKPVANTTARALVKKRMMPFDYDNDTPEIRGVEECLIAFGYAELLRYERRGDAAAQADQEALALLNQLRESNTWIESNTKRITPAEIYESEPFEAKGYW